MCRTCMQQAGASRVKRLIFLGGGAEGDRTPDLLIANEALSQLSYGPRSRETGATMLADPIAVKGRLSRLLPLRTCAPWGLSITSGRNPL